jgi:hypothetical protein
MKRPLDLEGELQPQPWWRRSLVQDRRISMGRKYKWHGYQGNPCRECLCRIREVRQYWTYSSNLPPNFKTLLLECLVIKHSTIGWQCKDSARCFLPDDCREALVFVKPLAETICQYP